MDSHCEVCVVENHSAGNTTFNICMSILVSYLFWGGWLSHYSENLLANQV